MAEITTTERDPISGFREVSIRLANGKRAAVTRYTKRGPWCLCVPDPNCAGRYIHRDTPFRTLESATIAGVAAMQSA